MFDSFQTFNRFIITVKFTLFIRATTLSKLLNFVKKSLITSGISTNPNIKHYLIFDVITTNKCRSKKSNIGVELLSIFNFSNPSFSTNALLDFKRTQFFFFVSFKIKNKIYLLDHHFFKCFSNKLVSIF